MSIEELRYGRAIHSHSNDDVSPLRALESWTSASCSSTYAVLPYGASSQLSHDQKRGPGRRVQGPGPLRGRSTSAVSG